MNDPRDEDQTPQPPDNAGHAADAYSPPPRDPGGKNQLMTGALLIAAVAIVVFLVFLVIR